MIFAPGVSPEKLEAVEEKLILTAREANVKKESKAGTTRHHHILYHYCLVLEYILYQRCV